MKVLFLDAYNLIYRSLSGFKSGEHYVVYNFFRSLRPLIEKHNPDQVYFVLEGNPKFRSDISGNTYKSNRKSQGDSFHRQKAAIINIVKEYLPFSVVRHPELECDDTIATLSVKHAKEGDSCVIVSSDSDFIQLLNLDLPISIYHPIKKKFIPVPDYDYVMWKALRGDATDNIPGIPGVGDKTATKLINDSEMLANKLSIVENREIFERNINLIRLVDFSNDMTLMELSKGRKNFSGLRQVFEDLDFGSMLKDKTWEKYVNTFERL